MPKTHLWLSTEEAFYRREMISKHKWLTYYEILEFFQGGCKIKSRGNLVADGYTSQLISYIQLL